LAVFDGKTQERITPGLEKSQSVGDVEKAFLEVGQIFPQIYDRRIALPAVVYQEGLGGSAVKGVTTDEFWLSPPFGRPRDIDYTTLKKLEKSEWVRMCLQFYIDSITNAEWDIVPVDEDKTTDPDVQEHCDEVRSFLEHLPSEESFDVILAKMIPDWKLYDCGTILKVYPTWAYDENGYFMNRQEVEDLFGKDMKIPILDLTVKDGRSMTIEAPPVGGRWRRFWQYSWMSPTSIPTPFDVREVIYLQSYPTGRGVYGTANLEVVQNIVNYLIDSVQANSKFYENGMFIGGQIDHPDIQDPDELKRRAQMYKQQLRGPDKYGKWLTTGGNVKVTPLTFTNQQLQWIDGQHWFAKVVMGIFKVQPHELGFSDDLNRATAIAQANLQKSRALWPDMTKLERSINKFLVWSDFYQDVKFQFVRARDLEDEMKQLQVWQGQYQMNLRSVNQILKEMGKDPWQYSEFDLPMALEQQAMMPMPILGEENAGQFGEEGYRSDEQKLAEKAVNVSSQSGEAGFAFVPRVWDGQRYMRRLAPTILRTQKELRDDLETTRKKILEELKRSYGQ